MSDNPFGKAQLLSRRIRSISITLGVVLLFLSLPIILTGLFSGMHILIPGIVCLFLGSLILWTGTHVDQGRNLKYLMMVAFLMTLATLFAAIATVSKANAAPMLVFASFSLLGLVLLKDCFELSQGNH
jgi:hypothetical protein